MHHAILPLLPLLLSHPGQTSADGTCQAWLAPRDMGAIRDDEVMETSGMAASHAWEGLFWLHNDGGNATEIYLADEAGSDLGTWDVLAAENEDWEDMAMGPCLSGADSCSCIYIADSGDNDLERGGGVIWRIPEPDPSEEGGDTIDAEGIWFRFPDGSHDTEALLVDPVSGQTFLVTKEDGLARVYLFPEAPPEAHPEYNPVMLQALATLDLDALDIDGKVTGGAVSPGGQRVVLRTDHDLVLFTVPDGGALHQAFDQSPTSPPAVEQALGEALTFSIDGADLYLVGEGAQPRIWIVECAAYSQDDPLDPDTLVECANEKGCGCLGIGPSEHALSGLCLAGFAALLRRRRG